MRPDSGFQPPLLGGDDSVRLMQCNRKLQDLGINDTINVPQVVAIGDQSTGKSSLIEKISGIHVPKDSGLCTKCPIAINLNNTKHSTAQWSCKVSVEERFYFSAKSKRVTSNNPLGPWQPLQLLRNKEIAIIENHEELLDTIKQAEEYVLTPRDEKAASVADTLETFSPNIIKIDVYCNSPNLSFVDLPGVIQTATTSDGRPLPKYNVDVVKSLATQYARDTNNIMLLMLPMNHDTANIASFGIIRDERAQSRTVAVFTKPDCVLEEQQEKCLKEKFVDGRTLEFMAHHMVMLGEKKDFTEEEFFLRQPFGNLSNSVKQQFSVGKLTERLRDFLFIKIKETLPTNLQKIKSELIRVDQQLQAMPAPPDAMELPYQLREQLFKFEAVIKATFAQSGQGQPGLSTRSQILRLMHEFADKIRATGPKLTLLTAEELKKKKKINKQKSSDREKDEDDADSVHGGSATGTANVRTYHTKFTLEGIRAINNRYMKNSIPGNIEAEAVDEMIKMSVGHWKEICGQFIAVIRQVIETHVHEAIQSNFLHQVHLPLYKEIENLSETFAEDVFAEEKKQLELVCDAEQAYPFTLDHQRMSELEAAAFQVRKDKRNAERLGFQNEDVSATPTKKKQLSTDQVGKELEGDKWLTEVQMASRARAYYDLAATRFSDNICQLMNARLIPCCENDLVPFLKTQLGLDAINENRDKIAVLMSEDPEREALRARLQKLLARLQEGHTFISETLNEATTPFPQTPSRKRSTADDSEESPTKRLQLPTHLRNHSEGMDI